MKLKSTELLWIVFYLVILPNFSFASVEWYKTYNGPSNQIDFANKIQTDDAGNSYITGGSEADFLTIKYDANGNVMWTARYGNPNEIDFSKGLAVDCEGNVYVSGMVDYSNTSHITLLKYDPHGNLVWSQSYDPGSFSNADLFMTIAPNRIYIAVAVTGPSGSDIAIRCFDQTGLYLWDFFSPGSYEFPVAIGSDSKNVYVAGQVFNGSNYDFGLFRLDRNGILLYFARCNIGDDTPTAIKVTDKGEVLMTGFSIIRQSKIVTMKFDSTGTLLWLDTYIPNGSTNGSGWDISTDSSGNAVVAAGASNGTDNDYVTLKYSPTGQLLWDRTLNFGFDESAGLIATDLCGNIHVAGTSNGDGVSVVFDTSGNVIFKDLFTTLPNQQDSLFLMDFNRFGNLFVGGITDAGMGLYDYLLFKFKRVSCNGPRHC